MADFKTKIQTHINKLQTIPYPQLQAEVIRKRLAWFAERAADFPDRQATPRGAYEFLFRDYMGLDLNEVPVMAERADEIVWRSANACPTLEACRRTGLDTRNVCRAVYEKSTQALISCLDPQLRFLRSYEEIRPHAQICREWIVRLDFADELRRTAGGEGCGARVVLGKRTLAEVRQLTPNGCPAGEALRLAARVLGDENLCGVLLICSHEPQPEGVRQALAANISAIVCARPLSARLQAELAQSPVWIEALGG